MSDRLLLIAVIGWPLWFSTPPDLRPDVAVYGKYSLMATPPKTPATVTTDCQNCRGTGVVGDSVVSSKCPVCKGTGKVPATAGQPAAALNAAPAPAPLCKDGKCLPANATPR